MKTQAGIVWLAMALMVSTGLWLGGAVSATRARTLIERLVALVVASAQWGALVFVTDAWSGISTWCVKSPPASA